MATLFNVASSCRMLTSILTRSVERVDLKSMDVLVSLPPLRVDSVMTGLRSRLRNIDERANTRGSSLSRPTPLLLLLLELGLVVGSWLHRWINGGRALVTVPLPLLLGGMMAVVQ